MNNRPEEADEALQKAFAINPDFPFGHWLRGVIRKDEGEIIGALIQFRKAAELYDPKANDVLAEVNAAIFDIEMRLNRPVAARAALDRSLHHDPMAEELRNAFNAVFGPDSRLPEAARKTYVFRPADASHTESWKAVLPAKEHSRFGEAQAAFEKLTNQDDNDGAAWFNLGLVHAWLGEHPKAVEALQRSVELEQDLVRIAEAGALIEALRCGAGMEQQSDYHEHRIFFQIQKPELVIKLLEDWQRSNRLTARRSDQESGTFSTMILEETSHFGAHVGAPVAKLAAYLFIVGNIIRLWSPIKEAVDKVADEMLQKLSGAVSPPSQDVGFCNFSDVSVEAMLIPTRETNVSEIVGKLQEHAQNFFEDIWVHRPLKALMGASPLDAASHPAYQKRLLGLVKFIEECFISTSPRVAADDKVQIIVTYDFDRLRRKLGLAASRPDAMAQPELKIDVLSAAELSGLEIAKLDDDKLDQAFRTALKLDARELAGKFARDIIGRPSSSTHPDRYPYFNHLIQLAQAENDAPAIMALLDQAEKADAESNGGQRQGDYTLRRGQMLAKNGEIEQAYGVFRGLLAANSNELKYYGPATEAMLNKKKGQWALEFAEQGLAKARSQNNRDSEQYFMELAEAARKVG